MAKKRQGIHAIQAALLSNTQYIAGCEPATDTESAQDATQPVEDSKPAEHVVTIPAELYANLAALARYQNTTVEALVALAAEDLLALRHRQLKAALEAE